MTRSRAQSSQKPPAHTQYTPTLGNRCVTSGPGRRRVNAVEPQQHDRTLEISKRKEHTETEQNVPTWSGAGPQRARAAAKACTTTNVRMTSCNVATKVERLDSSAGPIARGLPLSLRGGIRDESPLRKYRIETAGIQVETVPRIYELVIAVQVLPSFDQDTPAIRPPPFALQTEQRSHAANRRA